MRKLYRLALVFVAGLALCACEKESASSALPGVYRLDKAKLYENIPETFDGRYLDTVDIDIEIEEVRVLPAGAEGNEEGEGPVLAFWYDATNKSEEELSAFDAWIRCFVPTQHQDQLDDNFENDLAIAKVPDSRYKKTQNKKLKRNESAKSAIAFKVADMKAPVALFAKTAQGKLLGSQDYNPADLLKDRLLKKTSASDKTSPESAAAGTKTKQKGKEPSKRVEGAIIESLNAMLNGAVTKGNIIYWLKAEGYTDAEINEALTYIDLDDLYGSPNYSGRDPYDATPEPIQPSGSSDTTFPGGLPSDDGQAPYIQTNPSSSSPSVTAAGPGASSYIDDAPVDDYTADWPDWSATDPAPPS
ncbi:hypothetical protein HMPREF2626_03535 [Aerococcus sp. HMSC062A02]|uniref:DUF5067 domain-containing protein n=1 Tax=Aerococcus sp. HMSC062A02 TaxID=1715105 RepID=UPI0008A5491A|nr:DUF5067 domain-containing protein [Aerococcus sp. HMSC062A02]OFN05353.1 hypothetical protein HMPREF2626_03535 [Aerococcus sp. HMSC062A02]